MFRECIPTRSPTSSKDHCSLTFKFDLGFALSMASILAILSIITPTSVQAKNIIIDEQGDSNKSITRVKIGLIAVGCLAALSILINRLCWIGRRASARRSQTQQVQNQPPPALVSDAVTPPGQQQRRDHYNANTGVSPLYNLNPELFDRARHGANQNRNWSGGQSGKEKLDLEKGVEMPSPNTLGHSYPPSPSPPAYTGASPGQYDDLLQAMSPSPAAPSFPQPVPVTPPPQAYVGRRRKDKDYEMND